MSLNNILGLILCFGYVFGMIGLAEGLRRRRGYSSDFTRKVVHIGVGMMLEPVIIIFIDPMSNTKLVMFLSNK